MGLLTFGSDDHMKAIRIFHGTCITIVADDASNVFQRLGWLVLTFFYGDIMITFASHDCPAMPA